MISSFNSWSEDLKSRVEKYAVCKKLTDELLNASRSVCGNISIEEAELEPIARMTIELLRERRMTIGFAESCTAGMISAKIADIPGSSDVLLGGVVSYANTVKTGVLGVSEDTISKYGAVSEQCAHEMAEGARKLLNCSISVSVTGIAGPGGGTPTKPVGTVCFGVSDKDGTIADILHFGEEKNRTTIRRLTVAAALIKISERICS